MVPLNYISFPFSLYHIILYLLPIDIAICWLISWTGQRVRGDILADAISVLLPPLFFSNKIFN